MSQIMVEVFARGLLDKIMIEAFDVADTNLQDRKHWRGNFQAESKGESLIEEANVQRQNLPQISPGDTSGARRNDLQTPDSVAQIMHGLCDMQIGDNSYVLPPNSSLLERQVKHALNNIEVTNADGREKGATQGQGDVDETGKGSAMKTGKLTTSLRGRESHSPSEAQRISVSLLHRMIEDFETRRDESDAGACGKLDAERVAEWEEREETFVRAFVNSVNRSEEYNAEIDGRTHFVDELCPSKDERPQDSSSPVETPRASSSIDLPCVHEIDLKKTVPSFPFSARKQDKVSKGLKSYPGSLIASSSILPISDETEEQSKTRKKQKKQNLGTRLKKFFLSAFGRRKH